MLQGFAQLSVAFLDFFEQTYVLYGDHGLGCKGFEQFDLSVCERTNLSSSDIDQTYRSPLSEHRCTKKRPRSRSWLVPLFLNIVNMCCLARKNRSAERIVEARNSKFWGGQSPE